MEGLKLNETMEKPDQNEFKTNLVTIFLSYIYRMIVYIRNILYDSSLLKQRRLSGSVISIGNISSGGTGKSPLVIEIAEELLKRKYHPAILTRGYKSSIKKNNAVLYMNGVLIAKKQDTKIYKHADEARMQSVKLKNVPVIVSPKRYEATRWFLKLTGVIRPTHWILDDGFQHRQIYRDFNIVLCDAKSSTLNSFSLPAGPMRERLSSLTRADMIILTRSSNKTNIEAISKKFKLKSRLLPIIPVFFITQIKELHTKEKICNKQQPSLLVTSIANPQRLSDEIKSQGITIGEEIFAEDHSSINRELLCTKLKECLSVITTEKDFWRDPEVFVQLNKPIFIAELSLNWGKNKEQLIKKLINTKKSKKHSSF